MSRHRNTDLNRASTLFTSSFFRRLFLPYLVLLCAATAAVGFFAASRLGASYTERTRQSLSDESQLVADLIRPNLAADRYPQLNEQVRRLGQPLGQRITVIKTDGTVVADNEADPSRMDNHRNRPEIVGAAARGLDSDIRHSDTLHQDLLYLARRIPGNDGQTYYLRMAVHLAALDEHIRVLYVGLGTAALLTMAAAALICYYFARRHARPLLEITRFANALAREDLGRRILRPDKGEFGTLAVALNSMADSLSRLIAETNSDKAELLAILTSMSEGVIATDSQQRIVVTNSAAANLLAFDREKVAGKFLWEAVREEPIIKAAADVLGSGKARSFQMGPVAGRYLEITAATFPDAAHSQGLIVMAHDTTQSVRYQELRKEFVANVSHELRTPLSVIKGFVETLKDGALHDPTRGPQYLATIDRHTGQLTNLVNDLLELSRLESQPGLPQRVPVNVAAVVRKAVDLLLPAAQRKGHAVSVDLETNLPAVAGDPDYLERAVANLLDNAIKYTPAEGRITVSARMDGPLVQIAVTDTGIGIPAEDLPRIFERFYRVDRSRSREMGGTGLGLSIVKHIVQAHGGTVEVTSTPGMGSTFRLRLPALARSA